MKSISFLLALAGLAVGASAADAPKANANDKSLTVTLKPGETAVLGYSYR